MTKQRVLFVCIHNSARSQMAEAFLNKLGTGKFYAESAGIEPGDLNPIVVKAMKEIGFDISGNSTNSVQSFIEEGRSYDYVITVCDETSAERCPLFPGKVKRLHWGFRDPSQLQGSDSDRLEGTRKIRDEIRARIESWLSECSDNA